MSFFAELKRRNVFRVGAAYAVVAWLLIQVADILLPRLGAPDWFVNAFILVIILGFPVALVIAWIFEVTPEGITTQEAVDAGAKTTSGKKLNAVIIAALVLAVIFMAVDNYVLDDAMQAPVAASTNTAAPNDEILETTGLDKSIAVLPFTNLSNDPDQEYFSDGLAGELINRLSQIRDLSVTGQNSSFYFKDRETSPREIGEILGVSYLLQGSVQRSGDQLRVTAQLMEAGSGFNLWSESYNRTMEDVFAIQDEISEAVTTALSVTIGAGEFDRIGMTRDVDAYELYLQAIGNIDLDGVSFREVVRLLEQTVAVDPGFALAWWQLSFAYNAGQSFFPQAEIPELQEKQKAALARVESLAPDLPELLQAKATENAVQSGGLQALETFWREQLSQNIPESEMRYGSFLRYVGRIEDSLQYLQRAKRRDPLSYDVLFSLSFTLAAAGRYEESLAELSRLDELGRATNGVNTSRLVVALDMNDEQLIRDNNYYPQQGPGAFWYDLVEDLAAGNRDVVAENIRQRPRDENTPAGDLVARSTFSAYADAPEQAASYLLQAYRDAPGMAQGNPVIWYDGFSEARQTPEFKELVEFTGMADYWRTTGNWADKCRPLEGNDDFECF